MNIKKLQKKYPDLKIKVRAQKGRQDSFWYEGDIATCNGYTLIANGDIHFHPVNPKTTSHANWEDIARLAKNDKGLAKVVCNEGESKAPYYWVNNNWFEIILPDGSDVMGDVSYDYDEAIRQLLAYVEEKI